MDRLFYSIFLLLFACSVPNEKPLNNPETFEATSANTDSTAIRLDTAIGRILHYIHDNPGYSAEYAFFIDMSIGSNLNRFFVVDLLLKKIQQQGLVAHGVNSNADAQGNMFFSNKPNSYCSSLGKYRVGVSYTGRFGKSYRLHGLEPSNHNALDRAIVLHQYDCVPDKEQDAPICNSLGCPMVSPQFFSMLEKIIDNSSKNILLYIYY